MAAEGSLRLEEEHLAVARGCRAGTLVEEHGSVPVAATVWVPVKIHFVLQIVSLG